MEESGINLVPENLVPFFHYDITYYFTFRGTKILKHVRMFLSEVSADIAITVSHEHRGYIWLNYDEGMSILRFANQRKLLEYANNYIVKQDKMKKLNDEYRDIPYIIVKTQKNGNILDKINQSSVRVEDLHLYMKKFKKYRLTGILFSVPGDNETLLNIRDYF